jgi:hypothetical protein
MAEQDFRAYYWAGIAVLAIKSDIEIECLDVGDANGLNGKAILEPISSSDMDVGLNSWKARKVEDYVTTLLAGSAASFIRVLGRRGHLKRSLGDAGLEMRFLREVWQCFQPEPDRAMAIICGSLGKYDDGDAEATFKRLWHRAVRILRQPQHDQQIKLLAKHLLCVKRMTGEEVHRLISR